MRVGIEYIATGVIKVTTPFRQKTLSLTKHRSTFSLDFNSLKEIPAVGFFGYGTKTQENMVLRWDANDHELYVRVGDDAVTMPRDTKNLILNVTT